MSKFFKLFFISFFFSLIFWWGVNLSQENLQDFFYAQISSPIQKIGLVSVPQTSYKPKPDLDVKSAISIKVNQYGRKRILFKKNSDQPLPIASLTKLMTSLIVVQTPEDYNFSKSISISREAAAKDNVPENGNLKEGEKKRVEELLDLMLVYSSNDSAFALSEIMGVNDFVKRMNWESKILGLENTHFVNPTGLDPEIDLDKNILFNQETKKYFNYSTARDLADLSQYILNEFPLIFEISSHKPHYPPPNGIFDINLGSGQNLIGGKTGYTDASGGCMVLLFEKEGKYFINIILGAKGVNERVREMQKLINWINS